jgi:hypothetical protein
VEPRRYGRALRLKRNFVALGVTLLVLRDSSLQLGVRQGVARRRLA